MKDVFFIAEAGVNHNGQLSLAKELVDVAKEAGADAVKFQTFISEEVVSSQAPKATYQSRNTGKADESQLEMVRKLELSFKQFSEIKSYCDQRNIEFMSTPFDHPSLEFLAKEIKVKRLKVPSGEITNAPFLVEFARTGLPLIVSSGMALIGDIEMAFGALAWGYINKDGTPSELDFQKSFCSDVGRKLLSQKVALLHCTTDYPADISRLNLSVIPELKRIFDVEIGYSDHSLGLEASIISVALGASIIEKHFTLSKELPGPDHKASLEPEELKQLVRMIRSTALALGKPIKVRTDAEFENAKVARRSLVAKKSINQGELFTTNNLSVKRPGSGVSPFKYWDYLGRVASRSYSADEMID